DEGRARYEAAHLPGAVYAHLDRDLAAPVGSSTGRHPLPHAETLLATLRGWSISDETQIVAYDDAGGALAARLWWLARWLGHHRVAVLDGGLAAWQEEGRPVTRREPAPRSGRLTARPSVTSVVDTAELRRRLELPQRLPLVDARAPERFAGHSEPIDTVAGHVPGAINFPCAQNIADDGRWRPAADLRRRWEATFADGVPAEWAVMCGSGVTACQLVLSAELAGLAAPRLYAGSWSEWIRDPSRPVAVGAADADSR
ncbi:MAG TPA: sulfurtransferase, partial [Woeseiaceae bacterium]|nr:sulfurtransferase [Woeseiaceae bacterium]